MRGGRSSLKQVIARLEETTTSPVKPVEKLKISDKKPDNVYISLSEENPVPIIIQNIDGNHVTVEYFVNTRDFFWDPVPSRSLLNFELNGEGVVKEVLMNDIKDLKLIKGMLLECKKTRYIQPLIHFH